MSNETPKTERGLYNKYTVKRTDGTDEPGGKHHGCEYFVLDLTHDPFALFAIDAYAKACEQEYPYLAIDLRKKAALIRGARKLDSGELKLPDSFPDQR